MRVNHKRVSFPLGYRQYSADSAWHPHQYQTNSCSSSRIPQIHPHLPSPAKTWWCAPDHAPKLTNILLSLDTPMTQNILCCSITCTPHMCGLWFALFRWHSLSCSTTCFPFPTPTHVDMCAHTHTHTPLKKKKKKGYSSNLARWSHHETMYCFPSLGVGGNFSGNLRETLFLSLWIILWGCTSVLLERTSGCNEGDKTYYKGWKPEFCDLV